MVSVPLPPARKSLPPKPLIESALSVPLKESLPSVPFNVAMSDHPDVARGDGGATVYGGNKLRIGAALSIGVVVELPGRCIEADAIVSIVSAARAGGGVEARIAGGEVSRAAERVE